MATRAKAKDAPRKRLKYTEEMADRICALITEGESLIAICASADMPDRSTVFDWLDIHQTFADKYTRARARQAEFMDDLINETARNSKPETAASDRVKIDAFKWRAGKLRPKRYGDKIVQEHTGADGGAIQIETKPDLSDLNVDERNAVRAILVARTEKSESGAA